jgi:hypothetical protein
MSVDTTQQAQQVADFMERLAVKDDAVDFKAFAHANSQVASAMRTNLAKQARSISDQRSHNRVDRFLRSWAWQMCILLPIMVGCEVVVYQGKDSLASILTLTAFWAFCCCDRSALSKYPRDVKQSKLLRFRSEEPEFGFTRIPYLKGASLLPVPVSYEEQVTESGVAVLIRREWDKEPESFVLTDEIPDVKYIEHVADSLARAMNNLHRDVFEAQISLIYAREVCKLVIQVQPGEEDPAASVGF